MGTKVHSNVRRAAAIITILLLTGSSAWLFSPRANTVIRIARGGTATIQGGLLRRSAPLGDTIAVGGSGWRRVELVNEDTIVHQIAMFRVPAGATSSYRVPPGVYGGLCTAHPTTRAITFIAR